MTNLLNGFYRVSPKMLKIPPHRVLSIFVGGRRKPNRRDDTKLPKRAFHRVFGQMLKIPP
jgi:hypothetical protein